MILYKREHIVDSDVCVCVCVFSSYVIGDAQVCPVQNIKHGEFLCKLKLANYLIK